MASARLGQLAPACMGDSQISVAPSVFCYNVYGNRNVFEARKQEMLCACRVLQWPRRGHQSGLSQSP